MSVRESVLEEARRLVSEDRAQQYGSAEHNFGMTAALWSAAFGWTFGPEDVALAMVLLKAARAAANPSVRDSWVDMAGYAAIGAELVLPAARPWTPDEVDSETGVTAFTLKRACELCGETVGDCTPEEIWAAQNGTPLPDLRTGEHVCTKQKDRP